MESRSVSFVLPSEFATIERMVDEAERFFSARVSDEDTAHNLLLLASEAVTNGVEHGNKFDAEKKVTITFSTNAHHATVTVEDEGSGFERIDVPDPVADDHLFASRGRGLFLMEQLADEIRYENGGRRIVVIVRLPD